MTFSDCVYIPDRVCDDINSMPPKSRECIINALVEAHHNKLELQEAKAIVNKLEQQVEDLQKALDTVLLNKCRVRKVKVKVYGRGTVDKTLHRYVRQAED